MTDRRSPETGPEKAQTGGGPLVLTHPLRRVRVLAPVWPPVETPDYLEAKAAFAGHLPVPAVPDGPKARGRRRLFRPRRRPHKRARGGIWLLPSLILLVLALVFSGLALTGKPLRVPVWAVAEVETRINQRLEAVTGQQTGGSAVSLGGLVLTVDEDWIPRLRLEDLRLLQPDGTALLSVPEFRVSFDPGAVLRAQIRLRSVRMVGARLNLKRMTDGQFDIALGPGVGPRPVNGIAGLIDATVAAFALPVLDRFTGIQAEGLTVTVDDRLLGRVWEMGDGRMRLLNRDEDLALELGVSLVSGGKEPAQADLTLIAAKATSEARLTVTVDQIAAADLAAQAAPLAFLGVLDAPISGQIFSTLDDAGALASLEARLAISAGTLHPSANTKPVGFDEAGLFFSYDPTRERIDLRELTVSSSSLRISAAGHAYLPGVTAGVPGQVLAQIRFSRAMFDPVGLFEAPVQFDQGALDLRLRLNPFTLDIGQLTLQQDGHRLLASGRISAQPEGWSLGLDMSLDAFTREGLLGIWPESLVVKTRAWVSENVLQGDLTNVRAALRLVPGQEVRLSLGYDFAGGSVRFLKTLPPILNGSGYAVIDGKSYTTVLTQGFIRAPEGGDVNVAGSVFSVADITQKPARADISLTVSGGLTAALSLLDQEPFRFISKANLAVGMGQGQVTGKARLRMPLMKGVKIDMVDFEVAATVSDFRSEVLLRDRLLEAPQLAVTATQAGLEIAGKGTLNGVAFDGVFSKGFAPAQQGTAQISGRAELSGEGLDRLAIALPPGLLRGSGTADFEVGLVKGKPPSLTVTSDLEGVGLSVPELGWSKGMAGKGALLVSAQLAQPPVVDRLQIQAAGLKADGALSLKPDGSLDRLRFANLQIGDWLNVAVDLTGRGKGRSPAVAVTGGRMDLRGLSRRSAGTGGPSGDSGPLRVALDRLQITKGIELTAFRTELNRQGSGVSGAFSGRVNGQVPVTGQLQGSAGGTRIHVAGNDAGSVLSAAGVFPNAQGGALDVSLVPTGETGSYDGVLKIAGIRIRKAPALAELINAISVVGILDQMNGSGLLFSETEAEFRLTPKALQITRGSATGGSLGVSVAGLYVLNGGRLDMQGVISPVYLLNGIGALFTRKGEGLFGFNYSIKGTAQDPKVSVNPLSILTPGMFREIFRAAPPQLEPDE